MDLKEIVLLERANKIPQLPTEPWARSLVIQALKSQTPEQILEHKQMFEEAQATLDKQTADRLELLRQEHLKEVSKVKDRLLDLAKPIRMFKSATGPTCEVEGELEYVPYSNVSLEDTKRYCRNCGLKVSMKGALDYILKDIAEQIVNGQRKFPTSIELDRIFDKSPCDSTLKCPETSSATPCSGVRSIIDGGKFHCYSVDVKLVPK